jgi:putative heme transporter
VSGVGPADPVGSVDVPAAPAPRSRRKRIALAVVGAVVVVATFAFLLPRIASYADVWDVIRTLSWPWIVALALAAAVNIVTFAPPWMVVLPGLGFRAALAMTQASTALSMVVPGGVAAGVAGSVAMLRAWGFEARDVGRAVTLASLWSQFTNLTYPVVALALLTLEGGESPGLLIAAFVGVAVLAVAVALLVLVLSSRRLARELGVAVARLAAWAMRLVGRPGGVAWGGASFERFRDEAGQLLARRWHLLTIASFAGSLAVFAVLLVSLRALGVSSSQVTAVEAFAAWSLVRLIGTVPITPGGIGVIELGLTGALVGFGGGNARVVAAVLVFRFLTVVPTLVLGLAAAATWKRHRHRTPTASATG